VGLVGWIIVGLVAGILGQRVTGSERRGCLTTVAVGVLGGIIGGALFNAAGGEGITDFGIWSMFVAFVGACALLLVLQAVGVTNKRGRRR
jgi:uncharacterized membrane protein YeaQ/YmgE (transglycosylase-associated protein family)